MCRYQPFSSVAGISFTVVQVLGAVLMRTLLNRESSYNSVDLGHYYPARWCLRQVLNPLPSGLETRRSTFKLRKHINIWLERLDSN